MRKPKDLSIHYLHTVTFLSFWHIHPCCIFPARHSVCTLYHFKRIQKHRPHAGCGTSYTAVVWEMSFVVVRYRCTDFRLYKITENHEGLIKAHIREKCEGWSRDSKTLQHQDAQVDKKKDCVSIKYPLQPQKPRKVNYGNPSSKKSHSCLTHVTIMFGFCSKGWWALLA